MGSPAWESVGGRTHPPRRRHAAPERDADSFSTGLRLCTTTGRLVHTLWTFHGRPPSIGVIPPIWA